MQTETRERQVVSSTKSHSQFEKLLRSPGDLQQLARTSDHEFQTSSGDRFPILDGIVCLIPDADRGHDLGDARFYEEHPFGVRDWSNRKEVEAGVEDELKGLLKRTPKDSLIADVGCGSGRVSNYMSYEGFQNVLSLDYSLNSLRMVQENTENYCVWGNNLQIPIASDAFDLVISTGVIHHTPDPEKAFSECCRICKPGGLLFVKVRNVHSPYGYLFHTYGAALRFFERTRGLKWLSNLLGFRVYRVTRKIFYSRLPGRPLNELRGKYENLFIKNLITFFTTSRVKKMLADNHMEIIYGWKTSLTHRQHFYVAKKTGPST